MAASKSYGWIKKLYLVHSFQSSIAESLKYINVMLAHRYMCILADRKELARPFVGISVVFLSRKGNLIYNAGNFKDTISYLD